MTIPNRKRKKKDLEIPDEAIPDVPDWATRVPEEGEPELNIDPVALGEANLLRKILKELINRQTESISLYEELPVAKGFHESDTFIRLLVGSNRCLGGAQLIFDPVIGEYFRIDEIKEDFHVHAMNATTGEIVVKRASKPFIKDLGMIVEFNLSNGQTLLATYDHQVLDQSGRWIKIGNAFEFKKDLARVCDNRPSFFPIPDGPPQFKSSHPARFYIPDHDKFEDITVVSAKNIGMQPIWDISVEDWSNYECAGIINANSGKTQSAAVEFARAVTGQDPHNKYPKTGTAFIFGLDGRHIGLTIFPKLFQPGTFSIIKDEKTKKWRTYRPWTDAARRSERVPAPPLIPPRFYSEDDIAWEEKKTKTPKMVPLRNGWNIHFFSSLANLPQGQVMDIGWIDEEVNNEKLIGELAARTIGEHRAGRIMWSATRQVGSAQMLDLTEKAEDGNPNVKKWSLMVYENPYIEQESAERAKSIWSEDDIRMRWDGDDSGSNQQVFSEFSLHTHQFNFERWGIQGTQIPLDWSIYASVDPGFQICATSFWAVPPPQVGNFFVMFDELYIRNCTASKFAAEFAAKISNRSLEEIIIDHQGGRVREGVAGIPLETHYREQLAKFKISMRDGFVDFVHGMSDPKARNMAAKELLKIQSDGLPRFYVLAQACPNFLREIRRYRNKVIGGFVTDTPHQKNNHLMDTFGYLSARMPTWKKPYVMERLMSPAVRSLRAKLKRQREKGGGGAGYSDSETIRLG